MFSFVTSWLYKMGSTYVIIYKNTPSSIAKNRSLALPPVSENIYKILQMSIKILKVEKSVQLKKYFYSLLTQFYYKCEKKLEK